MTNGSILQLNEKDDDNCKNCFHFPTCGGGCPYERIAKEFEGKNNDNCDLIKGNLEEFLKIHLELKRKKDAVK